MAQEADSRPVTFLTQTCHAADGGLETKDRRGRRNHEPQATGRGSGGIRSTSATKEEAMYVRLITLKLGPGGRAAAEKAHPLIAEKVGKLLKSPPALATYEVYEPKA